MDIVSIATKVRDEISEHSMIRDMYSWTLEGCCAIASARLYRELKKYGFEPRICLNDSHCFLIVDSKIVDITAKQFSSSYDDVLIFNVNDRKYKLWWEVEYICKSVEDLLRIQRLNNWPSNQMADYI